MDSGQQERKAWGSPAMGAVAEILKDAIGIPCTINEASLEDDRYTATDLQAVRISARDATESFLDVGVRFRDVRYFAAFGGEFTIRSEGRGGTRTEIHKILEGWGDWYFYGWLDDQKQLTAWTLMDLEVFRAHPSLSQGEYPDRWHNRAPTGEAFIAPSFQDFPPELIIRQQLPPRGKK